MKSAINNSWIGKFYHESGLEFCCLYDDAAQVIEVLLIIAAVLVAFHIIVPIMVKLFPNFGSKPCRCGKGTYQPDGDLSWNGGMPNGRDLVENFYKCDHCGRVVSDQYPEYW